MSHTERRMETGEVVDLTGTAGSFEPPIIGQDTEEASLAARATLIHPRLLDMLATGIEAADKAHKETVAGRDAELARLHREIAERDARIERLQLVAHTDELTGLLNRHGLTAHFQVLTRTRSEREQRRPYSVLFGDLDHFKKLNDTHGHKYGDDTLVDVARSLDKGVREADLVARFGGEEFVVILADTDVTDATHRANVLCETIARATNATISIGVAQIAQDQRGIYDIDPAIENADKAMYAAKAAGRNRAVAFTPET